MSEAETLRLDDMYRRSLKREFLEEGERVGFLKGKSIGIEERTSDVIKNMLESNFDLKTISKITSKSLKEIKEIQESM